MVYLIDQSKRYAADCSQRFSKYKFRRFVHVHHVFLNIEILIPGRGEVGYMSNSASWWPPPPPSWRPSLAGTRGGLGRYGEGSSRATGLAASSRRRDVLGAAVLSVVYDAATDSSSHHQEAHDRSRRPHGHIFPDSGFYNETKITLTRCCFCFILEI